MEQEKLSVLKHRMRAETESMIDIEKNRVLKSREYLEVLKSKTQSVKNELGEYFEGETYESSIEALERIMGRIQYTQALLNEWLDSCKVR